MLTYDRCKSAPQGKKSTLWRNVLSRLRIQTTIPPQCSKVTKDSDAYRLQSYERQKRTQEIAFQKKNSTRLDLQNLECLKRVQDSRWTRQDNCTFSSSHTRYCTDSKQLPPPPMLESYQRLRRIQTTKLRAADKNIGDCFSKKKTRHGPTERISMWTATSGIGKPRKAA